MFFHQFNSKIENLADSLILDLGFSKKQLILSTMALTFSRFILTSIATKSITKPNNSTV